MTALHEVHSLWNLNTAILSAWSKIFMAVCFLVIWLSPVRFHCNCGLIPMAPAPVCYDNVELRLDRNSLLKSVVEKSLQVCSTWLFSFWPSLCIFFCISVTIEITRRGTLGPDPVLHCVEGDSCTSALTEKMKGWTLKSSYFGLREYATKREAIGITTLQLLSLAVTIKCTPRSPWVFLLRSLMPTLLALSHLHSFVFTSLCWSVWLSEGTQWVWALELQRSPMN